MMVSNAELDFNSLPYGKIYLIKSPSDKFLWEIKSQPNLEFLFRIKKELLYQVISNIDFFDNTYKNYIFIHYPKLELDYNFTPATNKRLFIWIPTIDGQTYNKSQKEFFKKYNGDIYSIIDLNNKTYLNELELINQKKILEPLLSSDEELLLALSENDYKHHPLKLLFLYKNKNNLNQNNFYNDVICFAKLISKLATSKPNYQVIREMQNFPKSTLKKLLVTPKLRYSELYKILRTNNSKYIKTNSLQTLKCDSLWFWYEIFIARIKPQYFNYPHLLLKMFFSWVYSCNTQYCDMTGEGFIYYKSYNTIHYKFEPSSRAIKEFYNLF